MGNCLAGNHGYNNLPVSIFFILPIISHLDLNVSKLKGQIFYIKLTKLSGQIK